MYLEKTTSSRCILADTVNHVSELAPPRPRGRLSAKSLLVGGQTGHARIPRNLLLRLDGRLLQRRRMLDDGRLAAPQANEAAHAAALVLEGRVGAPADGAGVLCGPGRGAGALGDGLVVEAGEGLELAVGEEPELQDVGGKGGVDGAGGELDERAEGQGHLAELVGEGGVAGEEGARLDGVGSAGRGGGLSRRRGGAVGEAVCAAAVAAQVNGRRGGGRGRRGGCGRVGRGRGGSGRGGRGRTLRGEFTAHHDCGVV